MTEPMSPIVPCSICLYRGQWMPPGGKTPLYVCRRNPPQGSLAMAANDGTLRFVSIPPIVDDDAANPTGCGDGVTAAASKN